MLYFLRRNLCDENGDQVRVKLLETESADIDELVNLYVQDIRVSDFPEPAILEEGIKLVTDFYEGDSVRAAKWMLSYSPTFGAMPIQILKRPNGIELVKQILFRVEHGIFT